MPFGTPRSLGATTSGMAEGLTVKDGRSLKSNALQTESGVVVVITVASQSDGDRICKKVFLLNGRTQVVEWFACWWLSASVQGFHSVVHWPTGSGRCLSGAELKHRGVWRCIQSSQRARLLVWVLVPVGWLASKSPNKTPPYRKPFTSVVSLLQELSQGGGIISHMLVSTYTYGLIIPR